jgi:hypothetical protein
MGKRIEHLEHGIEQFLGLECAHSRGDYTPLTLSGLLDIIPQDFKDALLTEPTTTDEQIEHWDALKGQQS